MQTHKNMLYVICAVVVFINQFLAYKFRVMSL